MYESLKEQFEDTRQYGYNPSFLRRIRARRRGVISAHEPAAPQEPVLIQHEFKARKRPTYSQKQIRSELATRAAAIHRATASLKVDLADVQRTAAEIMEAVGDEFGVTVSAIRGECRAVFLVAVRYRAIVRVYLAKPNASLPMIGQWFGRDHTSILHAVRKSGAHKSRLDRFRGIRRRSPQ